MFSKILIANRGEIACRIIKTAREMGLKTVAVFSDADRSARHVRDADEAVHIGASHSTESYLNGNKIIQAALQCGSDAIHPGYGFLSENADFVEAVETAGLVFIGPSANAIRKMGLKDAAKVLMEEAGVPVVPGYHGHDQDAGHLKNTAEQIGFPVLIKARAGGGGKGMRLVERAEDFADALRSAKGEGEASFGDGHVLIEKYITAPRHIEVQIFGDDHGNVVHLFERDCSLQRRHQKVIEEAPAPGMTPDVRAAMTQAAVTAAKAIDYSGAGTIEFIVDGSGTLRPDGFWFMEMNTRLQVEHPVTEAITGFDLVEWQIRIAAGEPMPARQEEIQLSGHAFESRLYAEDPVKGFLPATGHIRHAAFGAARVDSGVATGSHISPHYDPMIAKIITHGTSRQEALTKQLNALTSTHIAGTTTNAGFLAALCQHPEFVAGQADTGLIERNLDQLTEQQGISDDALLLAGLTALNLVTPAQRLGWRLWGAATHHVGLSIQGETIDLRVIIHPDGSFSTESGGIRLQRVEQTGTQVVAERDGHTIFADIICYKSNGQHHLSVLDNGHHWDITVENPLNRASNGNESSSSVSAPMTGVVKSLEVSAGQKVKTGERLLVMEAMKMELSLDAPRNGTIEEIFVDAGAQVTDGAVLIRLEELNTRGEAS